MEVRILYISKQHNDYKRKLDRLFMVDFETLVTEGTFRIAGFTTMQDYKKELKKEGEKLPLEYTPLKNNEILLYFIHEGDKENHEGVIPLSWLERGYREVLGIEEKD